MTYNIDLYSRYEAAFGFVAANVMSMAETALTKSAMQTFSVGDKTFADITLRSKDKKGTFNFNAAYNVDGISGLLMAPPMVSFSREKNISRTIIDNSDYEVIENFGKKSWLITLDGLLVDMDNHWYPWKLMQQIRDMFEIDQVFEVTSQLFNDMGINSIYFDRLEDLSFVEGFNDTVKYKLIAYSTRPTEFTLESKRV